MKTNNNLSTLITQVTEIYLGKVSILLKSLNILQIINMKKIQKKGLTRCFIAEFWRETAKSAQNLVENTEILILKIQLTKSGMSR